MNKLITHTPASEVDAAGEFAATARSWPLWDSSSHPCVPAGSGKFAYDYNGDYDTERVLIASGRATLTPKDGSAKVVLATGDTVWFHKGFSCDWEVHEPMTKHYAYFDADGAEMVPAPSISSVLPITCVLLAI